MQSNSPKDTQEPTCLFWMLAQSRPLCWKKPEKLTRVGRHCREISQMRWVLKGILKPGSHVGRKEGRKVLQGLGDLLYLLAIEKTRGDGKGNLYSQEDSPGVISFNPLLTLLSPIVHVLWVRKPKSWQFKSSLCHSADYTLGSAAPGAFSLEESGFWKSCRKLEWMLAGKLQAAGFLASYTLVSSVHTAH